jgi:hypothetical protein
VATGAAEGGGRRRRVGAAGVGEGGAADTVLWYMGVVGPAPTWDLQFWSLPLFDCLLWTSQIWGQHGTGRRQSGGCLHPLLGR